MTQKKSLTPGEPVLDNKNRLMRVYYGPDSTLEDWKKSLEEVIRLSEETGIHCVLIDVREQESLAGTVELFKFGSGLPTHLTFAVLCDLHLDEHRFIENVAINRGITVRDFDSEQAAIDWLKESANWDRD